MTFRTEFPDFPAADWPQLPADWSDASYHNDACPSATHEALGLHLFIDYADRERRELRDIPRFSLQLMQAFLDPNDGGAMNWQLGDVAQTPELFASDDVGAVLAFVGGCTRDALDRVRMGHELAAALREALYADQLAECAAGRADPPDFIDDNECTAAAYVAVFGGDFDPGEDAQAARANVATVLAARLIRGEELTGAEMLATVAKDFPRGLAPTITRSGAFEANRAQCLEA